MENDPRQQARESIRRAQADFGRSVGQVCAEVVVFAESLEGSIGELSMQEARAAVKKFALEKWEAFEA